MLKTEELKGKIALLHGPQETVAPMLISLAVRMQQEQKILFIDTIHTFTPSYVDKHLHKRVDKPLDQVFIARKETLGELLDFVRTLDRLLEKTSIRVIMISSLRQLWKDGDQHSLLLIDEVLSLLSQYAKQHGLITLVGNITTISEETAALNRLLCKKSDVIYAV